MTVAYATLVTEPTAMSKAVTVYVAVHKIFSPGSKFASWLPEVSVAGHAAVVLVSVTTAGSARAAAPVLVMV